MHQVLYGQDCQPPRTPKGHPDKVNSVDFSPDGKTVASASGDRTIKLWDVSTGKLIKTLKGHLDKVNSINFSSDGKTIVSASKDKTIISWNANSIQT